MPGAICIGIVKGERLPTWINGSPSGHGDLQLYYEGADLFYRAGPEARWAGLTVTRERLQAEARKRLGRELQLSRPGVMEHLHVDPAAFDQLTHAIRSLHPNSKGMAVRRDAEASAALILGAYVEAIASVNPTSAKVIRDRVNWRNEAVRRADAAMRLLIGNPYSSAQLCKMLGMSERNLELYFHEALGVSPKAWFQCLALHQARSMLRENAIARGSVTKVALACGFEHFGRFSEAYRELFGERPSDTMRTLDTQMAQRGASRVEVGGGRTGGWQAVARHMAP